MPILSPRQTQLCQIISVAAVSDSGATTTVILRIGGFWPTEEACAHDCCAWLTLPRAATFFVAGRHNSSWGIPLSSHQIFWHTMIDYISFRFSSMIIFCISIYKWVCYILKWGTIPWRKWMRNWIILAHQHFKSINVKQRITDKKNNNGKEATTPIRH